jgi:hypothetical protein
LATATGITPQVLDDLRLQKLIENLHAIDSGQIANSLNSLSDLLRPYQTWVFEEQVFTKRKRGFEDSPRCISHKWLSPHRLTCTTGFIRLT